jgi:hypothetical protein
MGDQNEPFVIEPAAPAKPPSIRPLKSRGRRIFEAFLMGAVPFVMFWFFYTYTSGIRADRNQLERERERLLGMQGGPVRARPSTIKSGDNPAASASSSKSDKH